ncbi:hypothetical protein [Endozoicomonas montiporae]|uniref:hypothetical protein n=1 Tax=Endozoicomonas montiporae TaxID=1027273 RepID=UPI00077818B2|nr:hypothetical protein [Endozoicomonas montiporae]
MIKNKYGTKIDSPEGIEKFTLESATLNDLSSDLVLKESLKEVGVFSGAANEAALYRQLYELYLSEISDQKLFPSSCFHENLDKKNMCDGHSDCLALAGFTHQIKTIVPIL